MQAIFYDTKKTKVQPLITLIDADKENP